MESRKIKFRQPLYSGGKFHSWHYWGFIDDKFIAPLYKPKTAKKKSQQFTGLPDKNGKVICQGDILKYKSRDYQRPKNYEVFWDDKGGKFMAAIYGYDIKANLFIHTKIIGNTTQNPELLENDE